MIAARPLSHRRQRARPRSSKRRSDASERPADSDRRRARPPTAPASAHGAVRPRATRRRGLGRAVVLSAFLALVSGSGGSAAHDLPDFTSLVAEHGPTVVNIRAVGRGAGSSRALPLPDLPEDSPYHDFFRRYFFGNPEEERFHTRALGSGFIISSDGYIICNYHVIRDADVVTVRLDDWREFTAEVVGVDERSDVGLLKIEATGLPSVRVGTGGDLEVGEWVLAIGSPFGFEHSATAGIVSAKGRSLPRESYVPFIQTDVAINPGNSGGPLFNLAGEVVGINSQIFSGTGGFMGLSFAIPIEVAMNVADQLRERGRVSRGWLGVLIDDVTPDIAQSFEMDRPRGAWIAKVLPDGPAAAAGFRENDIVLEFDGNLVNRSSDLPPIVGRTRVGARVPVKILREGKAETLFVLTAELPGEDEIRLAMGQPPPAVAIAALGLHVATPTAEQRRRWGLSELGVLVTAVEEGPALRAGIRPGDIILAVEGEDVRSAETLQDLSEALSGGKGISLLAQRQGDVIAFALESG